MPLIPGRRTSNMRQSALLGSAEFKNPSAEANTLASRPADLISLSSDLRTEISSSTTEIRGAIEALPLHSSGGEVKPLHLSGGPTGRTRLVQSALMSGVDAVPRLASAPVRIFGLCKSANIAIGFFSIPGVSRKVAFVFACSRVFRARTSAVLRPPHIE
jgi:hypothetical protein